MSDYLIWLIIIAAIVAAVAYESFLRQRYDCSLVSLSQIFIAFGADFVGLAVFSGFNLEESINAFSVVLIIIFALALITLYFGNYNAVKSHRHAFFMTLIHLVIGLIVFLIYCVISGKINEARKKRKQ